MLKKTLVIFVLLLLLMPVIMPANASQLIGVSDTMSRLKKSELANHTIQFTTPTGVAAEETIIITFPAGFNMGSVDWTDIDLKDDGIDVNLAAATSTGVWGVNNVSGQVITFVNGATAVATNSVVEIQIGTNADHQEIGNAQITNPMSEGTAMISINGTFGDSATLAVVILDDDQVVVTATVESVLSFVISPLATSTFIGSSTSAFTDSIKMSSTTTLPFGEQILNQGTVLGQQISVTTNAGHGYQVTLQQNQNLTAGTNDIDDFLGTNDVPQKWEDATNPNGTTQNVDTGWFGYTTSDESLAGGSSRFGAGADAGDYWAGFTNSNTPYEIAYNDSAVSNGETTNIGFKLEVNAYQPSGYYSGTVLTYICTATY